MIVRRASLVLIFLLVAASSFARSSQAAKYLVHVAYIIPANRQPTRDYQLKVATVMTYIQRFYADQMEAQGLGRKTFSLEKDENGGVAVHLMTSPLSDAEFAGEGHTRYSGGTYTNNALETLKSNGVVPYQRGDIWVVFMEAQTQLPDGSIHNGTGQGSSGFESGVCFVSSTVLSLATPENLHDPRPYDGLVVPAIGSVPLVKNKSFAWYEGDCVNSLAAEFLGAVAHEVGHCFQLQHTYLNDDNFNGTLMGNGFRGWRGYSDPASYPNEDTRLSRPSALILNLSPFFNSEENRVLATEPPKVEVTTPAGEFQLVDGKLRFEFSAAASTGPGVALATLENGVGRDGVGVVAWQEFKGAPHQVQGVIETSRIFPGREDRWKLHVFDMAGNMTEVLVNLKAPAEGLAPQPFIRVAHHRVKVGATVTFTGDASVPGDFNYTWNFGDGATATGKSVSHSYSRNGLYEVTLTETDPNGLKETTSQFMFVSKSGPAKF